MRTRIPRLIRCITSKSFLLACCAILFPALALGQVAPPTLFQLDGTAALNSSYPPCTYSGGMATCDYWDLLNGTGIAGTNPFGAAGHSTVRTFINGETSTEAFIGGGSKDPGDTTGWSCTSKSSPNKDTLTNGYAAGYTAPNGDLVTVFGADRFSVSGDANIGIWFFQKSVICNPTTGKFSGSHTTGDILVLSAFTVGGTIPTIAVYEWNPACLAAVKNPVPGPVPGSCANSNLEVLFSAGSLCDSSGTLSTLDACAITNSTNIPVSWPYPSATSSTPSTVPTQAFFTGGADITDLLKRPVCFTSFLEETRSSQDTNAVLKDFIGGSFPECHISVNKAYTCNSFNANGTFNYSYAGNVINDGGGNLFNVTVTDTPTGGTAVTYSCGNLAIGASKVFPSGDCPQPGGTTNTFTTSAHEATNTANARGDTSSDASTPPVTNTTGLVTATDATTTSCSPSPGLMVTKQCVTAFQLVSSAIEVRVDYVGDVKNTGQDNLSMVNVTDDVDSKTYGPFSLIPNQSICYTNGQTETTTTGCPTLSVTTGLTTSGPTGSASYFPGAANLTAISSGRASFMDTVNATGKDPFGNTVPLSTQPAATATATCLICPFGSCPLS
jgi:hypothetical protein